MTEYQNYYYCKNCGFTTEDKEELDEHIKKHIHIYGSGNNLRDSE